jgi:tetratricopeptide (TPR) repeat protein
MDVVMLTIPAEEEGSADTFWLPALVDDGQLYLFDTELGMPIPGGDGKGAATLAEAQADGTLLDALAIDDTLYRVTADEAKRAVANVVASPFELSGRARRLEKELTGDARLAISVDAQALAEAVGGAEGVTDVRLWPLPFQTTLEQLTIGQSSRVNEAVAFQPFAWRPLLYKARVLHFQGKKETRKDPNRTGWVETTDSHQEAGKLYMDPRVRPPNRLLDALGSEDKRDVYTTAKSHASYWLGLLSFDDGRYDSAADWLGRLLEAEPDGPWASGARYNLARTYEELGRTDEAVALLEADDSPGRHGNLLRARRLRTVAAPSP